MDASPRLDLMKGAPKARPHERLTPTGPDLTPTESGGTPSGWQPFGPSALRSKPHIGSGTNFDANQDDAKWCSAIRAEIK
jgi:hypothetical protein